MSKLKWIKHRRYNMWSVPTFPYFRLNISEYGGNYSSLHKRFNTLEEAKVYAELQMLELAKKVIKGEEKLFTHTTWCNNNGDGKYIHNREWKKYQWIEAGWNHVASVAKQPSIRFPIETPYKDVMSHARKIELRHSARLIKTLL